MRLFGEDMDMRTSSVVLESSQWSEIDALAAAAGKRSNGRSAVIREALREGLPRVRRKLQRATE
jgi:Arc/MetJ-type ribon-helix-helix transcriptional regulator